MSSVHVRRGTQGWKWSVAQEHTRDPHAHDQVEQRAQKVVYDVLSVRVR